MSAPEKLTYRVREVVALTGLSKSTVCRLIASGELPSLKVHGVRLVRAAALSSFLMSADSSLTFHLVPNPK